ncbi:acyltransferase [Thalassotalea agarivorans]|uniref:1-acyl-sn-glycerol-3-phosphate acyltransferase n=1 Tax=Thalassotalea agarivorans TaxID=349064 RepID=A0A1I0FK54_THASX|nr:acyltransferase [Thalassotalea agarivorans]SET57931.1 1-acyl-sn-glycerol-3-phosphate acyltransferase [Thalassotalea agarivorans]
MLSFLPSFILFPIGVVLLSLNLAFAGSTLFIGGIFKLLLPFASVHRKILVVMNGIFRLWALNNYLVIMLLNKTTWTIKGDEGLNRESWYLLIANHISWLDIFVVAHVARKRIPEPKFFLKEELKKVPFIGIGCWALDMPFMKRYSRSFIEKNPHLKGKDIETTKKSCERYKLAPTTIINFVEGTRITESKHKQQQSPFRNLLKPKAGGIAFTLATMGEQFDKVLNVTICYPGTEGHTMKRLLSGKLTEVVVDIEQIDVTDEIVGNYFEDESFQASFQTWLNDLWLRKDANIDKWMGR